MKKIFSFALVAMLAVCATASAQSSSNNKFKDFINSSAWSEASIQYNPTSIVYDASGADDLSLTGLSLEYNKAFSISKTMPLYVTAGLGLQYSFGKETFDDWEYISAGVKEGYSDEFKYSIFSVKIPVNLLYHLDITKDGKFAVEPMAGLNFRLHISATQTIDEEKYQWKWDGNGGRVQTDPETNSGSRSFFDKDDMGSSDATWNRFQLGYNVGANFVYDKKYVLGVSYTGDFTELCKKTNLSIWNIKVGMRF